jgi:hypothetical protein
VGISFWFTSIVFTPTVSGAQLVHERRSRPISIQIFRGFPQCLQGGQSSLCLAYSSEVLTALNVRIKVIWVVILLIAAE